MAPAYVRRAAASDGRGARCVPLQRWPWRPLLWRPLLSRPLPSHPLPSHPRTCSSPTRNEGRGRVQEERAEVEQGNERRYEEERRWCHRQRQSSLQARLTLGRRDDDLALIE